MKIERILTFVAALVIFTQMDCAPTDSSSGSTLESYSPEHWPMLMKDFSDLDDGLASTSRIQIALPKYFKHFEEVMLNSGLSDKLVKNIIDVVIEHDKAYEEPAYHGLVHSARIANLTASVLNTPKAKHLSDEQKVLILVSALFHDVDPARINHTPARVLATFEWMDKNQQAIAMFAELKKEKNIAKDQVKTLIKFTDFNEDPNTQAKLKAVAEEMAEQHFSDRGVFAKEWGMRLSYIDQVCMYVGSFQFAVQAVVGLANEIRHAKSTKKGEASKEKITSPTDVVMLSNTYKFLDARLLDSNFEWLPLELRENFKNVHRGFKNRWYGRKNLQ